MLVLLITRTLSIFRPDHAVSLEVVAPWFGVPVFDQIFFFLQDYSQSISKTYLQAILKNYNKINDEEFLWDQLRSILTSKYHPLIKAQLDSGYYTPRAEMYREMARSMGGSNYKDLLICSEEKINIPISFPYDFYVRNTSELFEFDFTNGKGKMIVYANLQNQMIADFVLDLLDKNEDFILRPTSQTSDTSFNLHGFGIEMRPFKYSMEYGVKDNIVTETHNNNQTKVNDETVKRVKGIPYSYIDYKEVDRPSYSLASLLIQKNKNSTLPHFMRDFTNNFPLFMPELVDVETSYDAHKHVDPLEELVKKPKTTTLLNGRAIDMQHLDIFTLIKSIQEEKAFKTILTELDVNEAQFNKIAQTAFQPSTSCIIDFTVPQIVYMNDIEKDEKYADWSESVEELTSGMFFGAPRCKKNLINLVIYTDPSTVYGLTLWYQLSYLIEEMYPIHLGIVPNFNLGNKLSRKVGFAFYHLAQKSQKIACRFLIRAFAECGQNGNPKEKHFASAYSYFAYDNVDWNSLFTLFDSNTPEYKALFDVQNYVSQVGIRRTTVMINGREIDISNGVQAVVYEIQSTLMMISQLLDGRVSSFKNVNLMSLLSRFYLVVPTIDSEILHETPIGLSIANKPLSKQRALINKFKEINWDKKDRDAVLFFVLYTNNKEHEKAFNQFMNNRHQLGAKFALNPSVKLVESYGESVLIANGRVINAEMTIDRLNLIEAWVTSSLTNILPEKMSDEANFYASCLFIDWLNQGIIRRKPKDKVWKLKSSLVYISDNKADITWDIIADPFTRDFQRIADMINYVDELGVVKVRLALLPPSSLEGAATTITTYYRTAIKNDKAIFTMLNDTTTYSVMTDMPNTWITESMKASLDLDNILLKELTPSIHEGKYILTNVMAEGYCIATSGDVAEGVELALKDPRGERKSDTIVMMSSAYWQLAANPGVWNIDLGGARSKMIYEMVSHELVVASFANHKTTLFVQVKPGKEGMKVYNVSSSDTSNITTVNVFSVASGHLYERLLKIMMLAVRRQSKYNVKFWIIKAFLSPQFKATLPIMAAKYNFSYQLVSYKWPNWLRPQFEKQRIIWGNKILFLDVLFPLSLERVVYIDSDQIVRTDLIELMRMDFGEAPYAFTPFCDSRKETEPFRFWKQGYWKDLLGKKKKYHISALFAINLNKFRQMAAGDLLRYHYQQLSEDPNSLANLDQDLPNYAQDHIPIYSLPQNWLWCETWCSDETMQFAKTIDLCNNPLTKKPKLYVAQNMVKEWPGLDQEVRNVSAGPDDYEKFFFFDNGTRRI